MHQHTEERVDDRLNNGLARERSNDQEVKTLGENDDRESVGLQNIWHEWPRVLNENVLVCIRPRRKQAGSKCTCYSKVYGKRAMLKVSEHLSG